MNDTSTEATNMTAGDALRHAARDHDRLRQREVELTGAIELAEKEAAATREAASAATAAHALGKIDGKALDACRRAADDAAYRAADLAQERQAIAAAIPRALAAFIEAAEPAAAEMRANTGMRISTLDHEARALLAQVRHLTAQASAIAWAGDPGSAFYLDHLLNTLPAGILDQQPATSPVRVEPAPENDRLGEIRRLVEKAERERAEAERRRDHEAARARARVA